MSLRLEMLQVARLAPKPLGDSTTLVKRFLQNQQNDDGGFKNRAGQSDLYYTVFGLDALIALDEHPESTNNCQDFLNGFGAGESLDFVHLCCLARAWAAAWDHRAPYQTARQTDVFSSSCRKELLTRIERHRATDAGYHPIPGSPTGTAYGSFLAVGAYQDLGEPLPDPEGLAMSLDTLATPDGVWANEPRLTLGSTNATAAVVTLQRHLQIATPPKVAEWLLARLHSEGGFTAMPAAPIPDLLSTATALHALSGLQVPLGEEAREKCLDFIDSLWTNEGGFHGHWQDDFLDVEYTFYGLLALGHLSL